MQAILDALLPVFAVIVLGYLFRRMAFPGEAFWPLAARITYYAFFPALLVQSLARARLTGLAVVPMAGALMLAVLLVAALLIAARRVLRLDNPALTSVVQGSIRPNTYVGLAGAAALFGETGLALAAIAIAALVPLVNVLSVATLTRYGAGGNASLRATAVATLRNPLIIACAIGIALNLLGLGLPGRIDEIVDIFGRAALPLGLLTVGAGLTFRAAHASAYPVLLASGVKLVVLPLLALALCGLFGVTGPALAIAGLFAALPCAPTAYILAQQLGGDVRLMAIILTAQTMLAAVTIPLIATRW
jgi:malonate transporter and related proteins